MSNARIQFSLASEEVWNAYNPLLKEGEIVTVLKANKKVKLVQGKLGGSTYSESTVIWDEDEAQAIMSRTEAAAVTATAQATAASDSASNAAASQSAAAMSATNAKASESAAKNSATSAASSASTASTQAGKAAENARLAEGYKTAAETAKSNASLYAANAKADSEKATASKEAAQSAATTASNFANASRSSANEARTYRDNAKNYSENVNVFTPSVSSDGVLSWTNKAGLANPPSVNIKGDKGDQGLQGIQGVQGVKGDTGAKGDRGATGAAATIRIGTVTTGAPGSEAVVTNVGTANDAVFNFTLPRGEKGADGGIDIDTALSDTSTNPVQNKVIKSALDGYVKQGTATNLISYSNEFNFIPKKVADDNKHTIFFNYRFSDGTTENAVAIQEYIFCTGSNNGALASIRAAKFIGNATSATQDGDGNVISTTYAKSSAANTWEEQQDFKEVKLGYEKYLSRKISNTGSNPSVSLMQYEATGAFTLDLSSFSTGLQINESTVFTAYITSSADYPLTITNAGTIKYIGSASDVAITSAGLLLNIMMLKDASGNVTSIVQASKLEGGA